MSPLLAHEGTCLRHAPPGPHRSAFQKEGAAHHASRNGRDRASHSRQLCSAGSGQELWTALQSRLQQAGTAACAVTLVAAAALSSPVSAAEPFLSSTGARGPLADEEAKLFNLRREAESEVRQELQRARTELEEQGRLSQNGKLCATPFGVDVVGITELLGLTGALVGGVIARQRKNEVEELNERLRKINLSLRQQARVSTMYAPGLTYAPRDVDATPSGSGSDSGGSSGGGGGGGGPSSASTATFNWQPLAEPTVNSAGTATMPATSNVTSSVMMTMDEEEMSPEARQCVATLREGKRLLKERNGSSAMVRFEKALMLAKSVNERIYERRSMRGLAAAARLQGQLPAAISHLKRVLEISREIGDHVGDADAHGTIADIYTDMGQFDKAAKCYDQYIQTMSNDGPV